MDCLRNAGGVPGRVGGGQRDRVVARVEVLLVDHLAAVSGVVAEIPLPAGDMRLTIAGARAVEHQRRAGLFVVGEQLVDVGAVVELAWVGRGGGALDQDVKGGCRSAAVDQHRQAGGIDGVVLVHGGQVYGVAARCTPSVVDFDCVVGTGVAEGPLVLGQADHGARPSR